MILPFCLLLALDAPPPAQPLAIWAGSRQRDNASRSLLLRVTGAADVDRVVLDLPPASATIDRARPVLPAGWSVKLREHTIEMSGPAISPPLYLRLDHAPDLQLATLQVALFAAGRKLHATSVEVAQLDPLNVVTSAVGVVLLPPLLTPGETFGFAVLDPRKLEGTWTLAGQKATAAAGSGSARPLMRVALPDDFPPGSSLQLVYTDPWREPTVRAWVREQSRFVPAPSPAPTATRLRPCGLNESPAGFVCACGWVAPESKVTIDGEPAMPVAASKRSVCFSAAPGTHLLFGTGVAIPASDAAVVGLKSTRTHNLGQGTSETITWTVTGSDVPLALHLRNTAPDIGTLEGGDVQTAMTSGGASNTVTRRVTGNMPGQFDVVATLDRQPRNGDEYPRILELAYKETLARVAQRIENDAKELPVNDGTVGVDDVVKILDRAQKDIADSLSYPELVPLQDSVARIFSSMRKDLGVVEQISRAFVLVGAKRVEAGRARKALEWLAGLFRTKSEESLLRDLCVVSTPEKNATARFWPERLPAQARGVDTNSHFSFYLGSYAYKVQKSGFDDMSNVVDFFIHAEPVMSCELGHGSTVVRACRLLTTSAESCP